jgi:hypothetical protein
MFWFYSTSLRVQGIFLEYARYFLHEVKGTFVYLLIFLICLAGFIALITFQHVAFSSRSNKNTNFWDFTNPGVLGILNILEFIWGLQFLRDACKNHLIKSTSAFLELLLAGIGIKTYLGIFLCKDS